MAQKQATQRKWVVNQFFQSFINELAKILTLSQVQTQPLIQDQILATIMLVERLVLILVQK